jgi:hypothetical protein
MNLDNLPRLRTMPAHQLERNIDRCNAILGTLDYFYGHHGDNTPRFQRTLTRRMFYISELERRTEIENMLGTMYARNQITHAAYNTALAKMIGV